MPRFSRRERSGSSLTSDSRLVDALRSVGRPLADERDLDPLLERVGNARVVLLGEASHGTSEYYTWRRKISERLIREKGFQFIAVEGDWPDCYRVNRFVRALDGDDGAERVLQVFERWPSWMWGNREVLALAESLRAINAARPEAERLGFYGLDVYSLWDSLHAVVDYSREHSPERLESAMQAYRCFEPFGDVEDYAKAASWGMAGCEDEVAKLLAELQTERQKQTGQADDIFDAEQNALVVRNAERYYQTMVRGGGKSWNVRDHHMMETLERLLDHHGPNSKAIVWEHNTHVGDARATDMARAGMVNVGQLAREALGTEKVVIVGFGSHRGSVIAGDSWGAPMERMQLPEAMESSWEELMHTAFSAEDQLLLFGQEETDDESTEALHTRRGHRAVGVVYHPEWERGNYVPTDLAFRYDAFLYFDETHALHPLRMPPGDHYPVHDEPETYPSGV